MRLCDKVKGVGEEHTWRMVEPTPAGFGANAPVPSGVRAVDTHIVKRLARYAASRRAVFLVDRHAVRETELSLSGRNMLWQRFYCTGSTTNEYSELILNSLAINA